MQTESVLEPSDYTSCCCKDGLEQSTSDGYLLRGVSMRSDSVLSPRLYWDRSLKNNVLWDVRRKLQLSGFC